MIFFFYVGDLCALPGIPKPLLSAQGGLLRGVGSFQL